MIHTSTHDDQCDIAMEVLCTIPAWPRYVMSYNVCNDFNISLDELHTFIKSLHGIRLNIHRMMGTTGETLSIALGALKRVEPASQAYFDRLYGDRKQTRHGHDTNPRFKAGNRPLHADPNQKIALLG